MRRWDSLTDRFINDYHGRGLSEDYVKSMERELGRVGLWLKARRPRPKLDEVRGDLLIEYLRHRTHFRGKATLAGVISKLRCFGEFLVSEGVWQQNPMKWIQGPKLDPFKRCPVRIEQRSMQRLWQQAARRLDPFARSHWLLVLALLYGLGLRRGEVGRLDVSDWQPEQGLLTVDGRKTLRQRQLAVPILVHRCLENYLPYRQNQLALCGVPEQSALLINDHGQRRSLESISRGIHRLARRGRVELASLHQFRHTCASDLLEAGARLPEVQRVLGHVCVATTMRYLHFSDPQRAEAVARHPLNDWLPKGTNHEQAP